MAKQPTLTVQQFETIRDHNAALIDGIKDDIQRIRQKPRRQRSQYENGQIDYWISALQALRWSVNIAAQKAKVDINAGSTAV